MVGFQAGLTQSSMKITESSARTPLSAGRWLPDLNDAKIHARACILVPLLFGLYSVLLGADANWDLQNYHLYNPFAWLNGRLQTDLAPAGMQSYFNPLLDVPFYWMTLHLPPRLVGFVMGVLHGLNFVLLLGIARSLFRDVAAQNRYRVPLLLALAGSLGPCFLSQLGNTMGDNAAALPVLGGLLVLLKGWDALKRPVASALALPAIAGLLVGIAAGLKLTSACFAVAMCVALLSYPGRFTIRLRLAFVFGVGVLLGLAISGGYWMWHMWQTFGNPLYPQFGQFFPTALAQPIGSGDLRFIPRGFLNSLLWPFIMGADPSRAAGLSREIVWPTAYAVLLCTLTATAIRRLRSNERRKMDPRACFVILFVVLGYSVWMKVFGIYRYLVSMEMLVPIVLFLLLTFWKGERSGTGAARWLIGALVVTGIVGGLKTWGHEGWSDPVYQVEMPPITAPEHATVVLYSETGARGWMVPFLPHEVAYAGIGNSFPAAPAYYTRLREIITSRGGPAYAIIDGSDDWRVHSLARADHLADKLGMTNSDRGCSKLKWVVDRLHLHAAVEDLPGDTKRCRLTVRSDDAQKAAMAGNRTLDVATQAFLSAGLVLDRQTCRPYRATIGSNSNTTEYRFCRVELR